MIALTIVNSLYALVPAAIIAAIYWGSEKRQSRHLSYRRLFRKSFIIMFMILTLVYMISRAVGAPP